MAVKNIDVWRAARHLIDGHKGPALNEAAMQVKDARKVGDAETEAVTPLPPDASRGLNSY